MPPMSGVSNVRLQRAYDGPGLDDGHRVLVDRAERRLKNLNYFKSVKITNEPGSASDRVILNVDVEEQSTGEFSIAGVADDRITGMSSNLPRITATSRAWYWTPSSCLKLVSCASSTTISPSRSNGRNSAERAPTTTFA